jgi:hypothetical protein
MSSLKSLFPATRSIDLILSCREDEVKGQTSPVSCSPAVELRENRDFYATLRGRRFGGTGGSGSVSMGISGADG